jgi:hypothetical protein
MNSVGFRAPRAVRSSEGCQVGNLKPGSIRWALAGAPAFGNESLSLGFIERVFAPAHVTSNWLRCATGLVGGFVFGSPLLAVSFELALLNAVCFWARRALRSSKGWQNRNLKPGSVRRTLACAAAFGKQSLCLGFIEEVFVSAHVTSNWERCANGSVAQFVCGPPR